MSSSSSSSFSSILGSLPSRNQKNFAYMHNKKSHSDTHASTIPKASVYTPTHEHTAPPLHQVISTEKTNILLRHFYSQLDNGRKGAGGRGKDKASAEGGDGESEDGSGHKRPASEMFNEGMAGTSSRGTSREGVQGGQVDSAESEVEARHPKHPKLD
eukprot:Nk52_evm25s245 gene=Nk52_evmTU25s245